jgi:hypothetical protein
MNAINKLSQYVQNAAGRLSTDYKKTLAMCTEHTSQFVETLPNWEACCDRMNQKGLMRFVQIANFVVSGDVSRYDTVSGAMCALVMLTSETDVTFENARFALSSTGNEDSRLPKGISGARLRKVLGLTRRGTVETKVSRTVGQGKMCGYLTALGITQKGSPHGFTVVDRAHPFLIAHGKAISRMSDSALALLQSKIDSLGNK